ncbi:MAG TPA: hypothetical protein VNQ90_06065 [Chthoniobacteraceae bacterium]|nr:hypothetical protein [Chthoniobacteraceae bacterium]
MDPKNRITVPAAWRSEEGGCEVYIRVGGAGSCLQVLTKGAFNEAWAKLKYHPKLIPEKRESAARMFAARTTQCTIDKQGRMVLPPHLCQAIDTSDGVILVGATDRFEVWNPQRWEETQAAEQEDFDNLTKSLGL